MGNSAEEIYDQDIAPKLLEIAKLCKENNFNFIATCHYHKESGGTTLQISRPNIVTRMIIWAIESKGNLDLFFFKALRYTKNVCPDHNSMVIDMLTKGQNQ